MQSLSNDSVVVFVACRILTGLCKDDGDKVVIQDKQCTTVNATPPAVPTPLAPYSGHFRASVDKAFYRPGFLWFRILSL
jgi:hypothetical protein